MQDSKPSVELSELNVNESHNVINLHFPGSEIWLLPQQPGLWRGSSDILINVRKFNINQLPFFHALIQLKVS